MAPGTARHETTVPVPSSDADRWAAVVRRDRTADGRFYYSVRTTGVYCRPGCAARLARRENVRFHATRREAEEAGFRPCKRCRPGAPPGGQRAGGAASRPVEEAGETSIRFAIGACSLGSILVAATDTGVCALLLGDEPAPLVRDLQGRFPGARVARGDQDFARLLATVIAFVEAPARGLDLPIDPRGTPFQQRVWRALRGIPAGATASYADIAGRIGAPGAVRAVAQACASNAIAVAIPCHRVVRHDGALSGYRWGVERKRALLAREGVS